MDIVVNASPLIALACIGRLNLLRQSYEHVTIPCDSVTVCLT
jgi:predicted nucleic acid-binding protein